jgi:hypothetical protein
MVRRIQPCPFSPTPRGTPNGRSRCRCGREANPQTWRIRGASQQHSLAPRRFRHACGYVAPAFGLSWLHWCCLYSSQLLLLGELKLKEELLLSLETSHPSWPRHSSSFIWQPSAIPWMFEFSLNLLTEADPHVQKKNVPVLGKRISRVRSYLR